MFMFDKATKAIHSEFPEKPITKQQSYDAVEFSMLHLYDAAFKNHYKIVPFTCIFQIQQITFIMACFYIIVLTFVCFQVSFGLYLY